MDRKHILNELRNFFKPLGYKKKGNIFGKRNDAGNLLLCEFQPSSFSNTFYLNFGIYFCMSDDPVSLKRSNFWHFESRFNRILQDNSLSLNYDMDDIMMANVINKIKKIILPQLEEIGDFSFLIKNFPDNFNHNVWWLKNISEKELIEIIKQNQTK